VQTLSVVIPCYNEIATLRSLLAKVLAVDLREEGLAREILVVDDGSTDGSREIVAALAEDWRAVMRPVVERRGLDPSLAFHQTTIRGLLHPQNRGKTGALRTGFDEATGDIVLIQDADLEYNPENYHALLRPILAGQADVVYGSRFAGTERAVLLYWHSVGNQLLTLLSNMATDLNLTDMETCYKVFRADVIKRIDIESERFGFEPEITIKCAKLGCRFYEVPIDYHGRGYDAGKKIGWRDGVEALYCITRFTLSPRVLREDIPEAGNARLKETLLQMRGQRALNAGIYQAILPWLGPRVIECGSGYGNITQFLLGQNHLTVTEVDDAFLASLRREFNDYDNVDVRRWDLTEPLAVDAPPDTITCLNVLEHIEDQAAALANARALLAPSDGRLVVLVPAHEALFSPLDEALGHHRRYSWEGLRGLLASGGFAIEHQQWFNGLGYMGWRMARARGERRLPPGQLALYNLLAPRAFEIERRLSHPVGLSMIAVARPA